MEKVLFDPKKDKSKYILHNCQRILSKWQTWLFLILVIVVFPKVLMDSSNLNGLASSIVGLSLAVAITAWLIYRQATVLYRNGTIVSQVNTGTITDKGVSVVTKFGNSFYPFEDFKYIKEYSNFFSMSLRSGSGFIISRRALTSEDIHTLRNAQKNI